jgi:hypothetical protein
MKTTALVLGLLALLGLGLGCGSVKKEGDIDAGTIDDADASARCSNGEKDGDETDVDCGGSCGACTVGRACATGTDCESGYCPADDLVCCDTACDSTCEACTANKTGATDGTCAAVAATTDPDSECADEGTASCGANGTGCNGSASEPGCNLYPSDTLCGAAGQCAAGTATEPTVCDGAGTCVTGGTVACAPYECESGGTACLSTCGSVNDCQSGNFCNAVSQCAPTLKVALQAEASSCLHQAGDVFERVKALLEQRGHSATFVTGADLDTPAEINAYDVVVLGGPGGGCAAPQNDWPTFDDQIPAYLSGGGGLVAAAWTVYSSYLNSAPNIAAALPVDTGNGYMSTPTVTPQSGHPISSGLSAFVANQYAVYGGGAKSGTAVLLTSGGNDLGEAWPMGNGRSVYLGPMYFEAYENYDNEDLLDGSKPDAIELVLRAIEWAGGSL